MYTTEDCVVAAEAATACIHVCMWVSDHLDPGVVNRHITCQFFPYHISISRVIGKLILISEAFLNFKRKWPQLQWVMYYDVGFGRVNNEAHTPKSHKLSHDWFNFLGKPIRKFMSVRNFDDKKRQTSTHFASAPRSILANRSTVGSVLLRPQLH
jgi:hypothetical protein